jgi:hypothetical protein
MQVCILVWHVTLPAPSSWREWSLRTPLAKRVVGSTSFWAVLRRLVWRWSPTPQCRWSHGMPSPMSSLQQSVCYQSRWLPVTLMSFLILFSIFRGQYSFFLAGVEIIQLLHDPYVSIALFHAPHLNLTYFWGRKSWTQKWSLMHACKAEFGERTAISAHLCIVGPSTEH